MNAYANESSAVTNSYRPLWFRSAMLAPGSPKSHAVSRYVFALESYEKTSSIEQQ